MSLAIAGLVMQALCNNKFVSPSTAATLSSAEFGVIVALLFLGQTTVLERAAFSFFFAMVGTTLFVSFVLRVQFKDVIMVPLIGIMLSNIIGGITTFIAFDNNMTQALESVSVGHFSSILKGNYEIVYLSLPLFIITLMFANKFNIVSLGRDFSQNLGLNYKFTLFIGLMLCSALSASIVVVAGTIAYVGLIIPNLIAIYKGDNLQNTLVDTALAGALYVLICDIISRLIVHPFEISVNIISGVIGSLVFVYLIFRKLGENKKRRARKIAAQVTDSADQAMHLATLNAKPKDSDDCHAAAICAAKAAACSDPEDAILQSAAEASLLAAADGAIVHATKREIDAAQEHGAAVRAIDLAQERSAAVSTVSQVQEHGAAVSPIDLAQERSDVLSPLALVQGDDEEDRQPRGSAAAGAVRGSTKVLDGNG